MIKENVYFSNNRGVRMAGRIYRDDVPSRRGIVFSHGLFSTKDGYKITNMADDFVRSGFSLLAFDFSFVGESEGRLEELSVLQEVRDLERAVDFFMEWGIDELHLMGSSMGGVVSMLYLASSKKSPASLTLVATPLDLKRLLTEKGGIAHPELLPQGGMTALEGISLNNSFYHELVEINVNSAASGINIPVLIVHGENDAVVDVKDSYRLVSLLKGPRRLVIIPDGDHHLSRSGDIGILKEETVFHLSQCGKRK